MPLKERLWNCSWLVAIGAGDLPPPGFSVAVDPSTYAFDLEGAPALATFHNPASRGRMLKTRANRKQPTGSEWKSDQNAGVPTSVNKARRLTATDGRPRRVRLLVVHNFREGIFQGVPFPLQVERSQLRI